MLKNTQYNKISLLHTRINIFLIQAPVYLTLSKRLVFV